MLGLRLCSKTLLGYRRPEIGDKEKSYRKSEGVLVFRGQEAAVA